MTKEERVLYYKEGYKEGWTNAMKRISMEAKTLAPTEDYYISTIADVIVTRPEPIEIPSKGKEINTITIMTLLDIWRKDKTKLPAKIRFRGEILIYDKSEDDYISEILDSLGHPICFLWSWIDNASFLNETVEIV